MKILEFNSCFLIYSEKQLERHSSLLYIYNILLVFNVTQWKNGPNQVYNERNCQFSSEYPHPTITSKHKQNWENVQWFVSNFHFYPSDVAVTAATAASIHLKQNIGNKLSIYTWEIIFDEMRTSRVLIFYKIAYWRWRNSVTNCICVRVVFSESSAFRMLVHEHFIATAEIASAGKTESLID